MDFTLPASSATQPNTFILTPDQIARQRLLAEGLAKTGMDYSPVQSPWQGAARLSQAILGAVGNYQANRAQNLGIADAAAQFGGALGLDPGSQNIAATPGQTTPALAESDARGDALQDAADGDGPSAPNMALARGLGATGAPAGGNPLLARALGYAPASGGSIPPTPAGGGYDYAMPTNGANTQNLNPAFADRIQDLQQDAQDAGIGSTLISGYRDPIKQGRLYANYQAARAGQPLPFPQEGGGGLAAPAGRSYHNFGNAADIVTNDPSQQAALTAMAREPWRGIYPGANFGDNDHYQIAGPINSGAGNMPMVAGAPPMAGSLAAYAAARDGASATPVSAYAGPPVQVSALPPPAGAPPSLAQGSGVPTPAGPQGAGVASPPPAPSQADLSALAGAMQAAQPPGGPMAAQAAPAPPNPALTRAASLPVSLPVAGGGGPAPSAPSGQVAPAPSGIAPASTAAAPGTPPLAPPPAAPAGLQQPAQPMGNAPAGIHPDIAALMNVISNPWATPQQQQVAMTLLQAQMPTPPTFEKIKDALGNENPVWVNPRTQTVTPINGVTPGGLKIPDAPGGGGALPAPPGSAPAPGAPAPQPVAGAPGAPPSALTDRTIAAGPVEGESKIDAIAAENPNYAFLAPTAKAVLRGQQPAPVTGSGQKDPRDMAVMQMVYAANPQFDASIYDQRKKALEGINDGSTPNSTGGMVTNAQTAIRHLANLAQASEELGKHQFDNVPGNLVWDTGARWFNSGGAHAQAAAKFDAAKGEFVLEATKFLAGGEGSDSARKSLAEAIDESASPVSRRAAIQTFASLMKDKLGVLGGRYNQGVGSTSAPYQTLDPRTQSDLSYIEGLGGAGGGASSVPNLGVGESHSIGGVTIKRVN